MSAARRACAECGKHAEYTYDLVETERGVLDKPVPVIAFCVEHNAKAEQEAKANGVSLMVWFERWTKKRANARGGVA